MKLTKLLILFVLIASCGKSVEIDNPTNKAITVKIGEDQIIDLKAYENKKISISGSGQEVFTDGELVGILNLNTSGDLFINPTLSKYYIEEVAYGKDDRELMNKIFRNSGHQKDKIEQTILVIGEIPYIGYAKEDSSLIIQDIWDYGVQESLPTQIKISGISTLKKKIYRHYSFQDHAQNIYNEAMKGVEN